MTNPYDTQTISNYNTTPPADDASAVSSNQLFWSKHKDKLADPIKTLAEAINTELLDSFNQLDLNQIRAITVNDTQLAADERKLISATGTIAYTFLPAGTALDGFTVTVLNAGSGVVTVEGDGSELINDALNLALNANDAVKFRCNGTGWDIISRFSTSVITLETEQASTSGTAIDFTGIPAGVKRITVMLENVETSGTASIVLTLGDSGGFETTGYGGRVMNNTGGANMSTSGYAICLSVAAADKHYGKVTLDRMNGSHKWIEAGLVTGQAISNEVTYSAGVKTLSGELTQVRVTTVGGSDTFDAGTINISYET